MAVSIHLPIAYVGCVNGRSKRLWCLNSLIKFNCLAALWFILSFGYGVTGLYLPGASPVEYEVADPIPIKVNSIYSIKTQVPLPYYSLPFCAPEIKTTYAENIGEVLSGDLIQNSPFEVNMKITEYCKVLCSRNLTLDEIAKLRTAIDDEYSVRFLADNLPAATLVYMTNPDRINDEIGHIIGYPVGSLRAGIIPKVEGNLFHELNNHVTLVLKYHNSPSNSVERPTFRVVGFEIVPKSIKHGKDAAGKITCDESSDVFKVEGAKSVTYTYDVDWIESPIKWATRWDTYFQFGKGSNEIHWFSIFNSGIIVLFLTGIVAIILLRTLLRDIARYNQLDNLEEAQDESGWKLVHGDVFRRPQWSRLLAVCAGTGIQILAMTVLTMIFAVVGFLSPANRGALLQAMVLLFILMGYPAGYVAARFARLFEGVGLDKRPKTQSLQVTCLTAFLYPGVCFATFFVINTLLWFVGSTGAVNFGTMFLLLLLWFGISVPLVFVGAHYGLKRDAISLPVKSNPIPREIPPARCLNNKYVICLLAGILPFGAVFTEFLFVLSSIWLHQFYYLFGFLALVLIILLITCAEISIAFTYFQLASEDYHWWWRSFWLAGTSGIYVFLYSICYFFTILQINKFVATVIFFGYSFLLAYSFTLLSGATGFITTFFFLRAIYGSIKIE